MTLGELIDNLTALRDSVFGVDNSTEVVFTDNAYTGNIEGLRLVSEPTVRYGAVHLNTQVQLTGEEV